jgi:hypothetical protein
MYFHWGRGFPGVHGLETLHQGQQGAANGCGFRLGAGHIQGLLWSLLLPLKWVNKNP